MGDRGIYSHLLRSTVHIRFKTTGRVSFNNIVHRKNILHTLNLFVQIVQISLGTLIHWSSFRDSPDESDNTAAIDLLITHPT